MSQAHRKKKNPEGVRALLIDTAISQAANIGLPSISFDAVAIAAGLTRGGVFHHFSSKRKLIDAVFERLLSDLDDVIDERMAADPVPYGRFTRAYMELAFEAAKAPGTLAILASTVTDRALGNIWAKWLAERLETQGDMEVGIGLETVRFAADGVWLGLAVGVTPLDAEALRDNLRTLSRAIAA